MSVETVFLHGGVSVHRIASGDVTGQDFVAADNELLAMPEQLARCRYVIMDFTSISRMNISGADVRQIADLEQRMAAVQPHVTVAIVAPTDVAFGMSRMWEVLAEKTGWETMVFRTRPEAEEWVGQKSEGSGLHP
jgi:hypothetical protein